jgi:glycosyltransferase involved in cell wall biosynthesis
MISNFPHKSNVTINMLGFVNQDKLHNIYLQNDILILPSEQESWGLVVNEAMMSGMPVLTTKNVGCSDDLIIKNKTGEIYTAGDIDEMSQKLTYMITNIKLYDSVFIKNHISCFSLENAVNGVKMAINALGIGDEEF